MSLLRVLRTASATLSRTLYLDELATDATGLIAVSITRLDGTVVQSGNATGPDVNHVYTFVFAGLDVLDELVVTWTASVAGDSVVLDQDRIQVVGGFLFSITEGRAVDPALNDTAKFTTAQLIEKRIEVEDEAERICGQAFVPRFARVKVNGSGTPSLVLPFPYLRAVRAVSVDPGGGAAVTTFTAQQLSRLGLGVDGVLRLDGGRWPDWWHPWWVPGRQNITVEFEHGMDWPPPELVRGAKLRFKSMVLQRRSPVPDRAAGDPNVQQVQSPLFSFPSKDKTGLPEVDAVYGRFPPPQPGFG